MDQNLLQHIYTEVNERICVYEKAILTGLCCNCSQAEHLCIAERVGIRCHSDIAQSQCQEFLRLLRQQARFALKNINKNALSHSQALKLQIGGLRGLRTLINLHQLTTDKIDDVDHLITTIKQQYDSLEHLPFSLLMQHIVSVEVRMKRRK